MELRWHEREFAELEVDELYALIMLRERVFVVEQKCAYLDADGLDPACRHLWATRGDPPSLRIAAYCRIVPPNRVYDEVAIGRVITAPEERGTGLGKELMRRAIESCGDRRIRIGAQAHLQRFYGDFGFVASGEIYDEDGIPHVEMVREVTA